MPDFLKTLLNDPKFWFAVYAVVQAVLKFYLPTFPADILTAIDALVAVVLGGLSIRSVVRSLRAKAK